MIVKLSVNMVEFVRHPDLLNDTCHSVCRWCFSKVLTDFL